MRRFQFSLRALLGSAIFVAVACPSLLYASETIASVVFTVTAIILLAAVVAAVLRRGASRAFWVGFAIFGWGYLWLAHWPEPMLSIPAGSVWHLQEYQGLATTKLMWYTYHRLLPLVRTPPQQSYDVTYGTPGPRYVAPPLTYPPSPGYSPDGSAAPLPPAAPAVPLAPAPTTLYPIAPAPTTFSYPSFSGFIRVGHSLWAWLFAVFGGLLARYFYATREKEP